MERQEKEPFDSVFLLTSCISDLSGQYSYLFQRSLNLRWLFPWLSLLISNAKQKNHDSKLPQTIACGSCTHFLVVVVMVVKEIIVKPAGKCLLHSVRTKGRDVEMREWHSSLGMNQSLFLT